MWANEVARRYAELRSLPDSVMQVWRNLLRKALHDSCRILDVGVGTGRFLDLLTECAPTVGIDRSFDMLRNLPLQYRRTSVHGDAEHMPFGDSSFDAVFASAVVHHLDRRRFFSEVARVGQSRSVFAIRGTLADQILEHPVAPYSNRWVELEKLIQPSIADLVSGVRPFGFELFTSTIVSEPIAQNASEFVEKMIAKPYSSIRSLSEREFKQFEDNLARRSNELVVPVCVPVNLLVFRRSTERLTSGDRRAYQ